MFNIVIVVDRYNKIFPWEKIPLEYIEQVKDYYNQLGQCITLSGRNAYTMITQHMETKLNIVTDKSLVFGKNIAFDTIWKCLEYCSSLNEDIYIIGDQQEFEWFINAKLINQEHIIQLPIRIEQLNGQPLYLNGQPVNQSVNQSVNLVYRHIGHYLDERYINGITVIRYMTRNYEELAIIDLFKELLVGNSRSDRTMVGTISLFGRQLKFDLTNGQFPLMTSRKMFLRGIFEELMFYLRGQTNNKILEEKKITVWSANTTREFLDKRGLHDLPEGDMGHSYGFSFRHFGAEYINCLTDYTGKGFDQLEWLINEIKTNPTSRRLRISLWEPNHAHRAALPPCLEQYQFYVHDGYLSCMMTQRSSDVGLAGGWNIATGALFTILLAKVTDLQPKELIWNIGDIHVYQNGIQALIEQITKPVYIFPKLLIKNKKNITDYEYQDLTLLCYRHGPNIKFPMNA